MEDDNIKQTPESGERVLIITRLLDAPRELVWKAWTEPEGVMSWWGPKDFTAPVAKIDFQVGGKYIFCMRSPEGKEYWSAGVYSKIIPYEQIISTDSFSDENGNVVPATHYGMNPDFPLEMLLTVTFEEQDGKTKLTIKHAGMPPADQEDAREGWNGSLDKLARYVEAEAKI